MFPALKHSYDALQVFVEAQDTTMANPGDAELQYQAEEAKKDHALHHTCMENLNILHGFVHPPNHNDDSNDGA
jgi:hypothetical protein